MSRIAFAGNQSDLQLIKLKQQIAKAESGFPEERREALQGFATDLFRMQEQESVRGVDLVKLLAGVPTTDTAWKTLLGKLKAGLTSDRSFDYTAMLGIPLKGGSEKIQEWLRNLSNLLKQAPDQDELAIPFLQYRLKYPHPTINDHRREKLQALVEFFAEREGQKYSQKMIEALPQMIEALGTMPIPDATWDHLYTEMTQQTARHTNPVSQALALSGLHEIVPESLLETLVEASGSSFSMEIVNQYTESFVEKIIAFLGSCERENLRQYSQKNGIQNTLGTLTFKKKEFPPIKGVFAYMNPSKDGHTNDTAIGFILTIPLKGQRNSALRIEYKSHDGVASFGKGELVPSTDLSLSLTYDGKPYQLALFSDQPNLDESHHNITDALFSDWEIVTDDNDTLDGLQQSRSHIPYQFSLAPSGRLKLEESPPKQKGDKA